MIIFLMEVIIAVIIYFNLVMDKHVMYLLHRAEYRKNPVSAVNSENRNYENRALFITTREIRKLFKQFIIGTCSEKLIVPFNKFSQLLWQIVA